MSTEQDNRAITQAAAQFAGGQAIEGIIRHNVGHINQTYIVTLGDGQRMVLQRINTQVFPEAVELVRNIALVTEFLRERLAEQGGDPARETLSLMPTPEGNPFYMDETGGLWRAFPFIEGTTSVMRVEAASQLYQAGRAFGRFQNLLNDFPAERLFPVIPHFHDTGMRYATFEQAAKEDALDRAKDVADEIAFVRARAKDAGLLQSLLDSGELPLRVTHNDTKINNVLMDVTTGEAVCVVDLDTVMSGSMLFDFGDAIRSGCNTADEDERDLDKVRFSLDFYRAFARGFLEQIGAAMTAKEKELLPFSARIMTYECGMRFLTDHLRGDVYFHIERAGQNLDRARTQFKLVAEMERAQQAMLDVQREIFAANSAKEDA